MADCRKVKVVRICPTPFGHAVFFKTLRKTFVMYMDKFSAKNIDISITKQKAQRPTTQDLMSNSLEALEVKIDRVLIDFEDDGIFHSTIYLNMENELGKKIAELDARPSDSLSLALRQKAPIYILKSILDRLEDLSELLQEIEEE